MKTLLIDNGSSLTKKLATLSPGNETIVSYDQIPSSIDQYSLVLLSGSSEFPFYGNEKNLTKEIELVRMARVPIVGICFGHEIIAHAYGAKLEHFDKRNVGLTEVEVVEKHEMFLERATFKVWENHEYGVVDLSSELVPLAKTDHSVAILKHESKPIYGLQFHPEHHSDQQFGDEVFLKLFDVLLQKKF